MKTSAVFTGAAVLAQALGAVGAKLSNPLNDLWALSMSFETTKISAIGLLNCT